MHMQQFILSPHKGTWDKTEHSVCSPLKENLELYFIFFSFSVVDFWHKALILLVAAGSDEWTGSLLCAFLSPGERNRA